MIWQTSLICESIHEQADHHHPDEGRQSLSPNIPPKGRQWHLAVYAGVSVYDMQQETQKEKAHIKRCLRLFAAHGR
jgi:hypothetical protein